MSTKPYVVYAIGGLGADKRVFQNLKLKVKLVPIEWIPPLNGESLESYSLRITNQIDPNHAFGLIGVSFGGMVALELNRHLNPKFTILISSVSSSTELPGIRNFFRRLSLIPIIPKKFIIPPYFLLKYLFSAKNTVLFKNIINETDSDFCKWALNEIVKWKFKRSVRNLYSIHGDSDRLLPNKNGNAILIQGGGHFMVVDEAEEVSRHINTIVSQHIRT